MDWRGNGVGLEGNGIRVKGEWGRTRRERGRTGGNGVGQQSLYEIRHFDLCIVAKSILEHHFKSVCKHSISNLEVSLLLLK